MKKLYKYFNLSINKYYRMNDAELEAEASKWKIRSYGNTNGTIERQIIIDALLKKDNANNSRYAIILSIFAIVVSVVALFLNNRESSPPFYNVSQNGGDLCANGRVGQAQ